MKSKIIFFDIDGTIIDHENKEIPESTINSLKQLIKNDHKVVMATGKNPFFIENFLKDYGITFDTYIALNGNYVVVENEVVDLNYLDEVEIKRLCDYCLSKDYAFSIINTDSRSTLFKDNINIKNYYNHFSLPYPKIIERIDDYKVFQMTVMVDEVIEKELVAEFEKLTFVRMAKWGMNVVASNGTKDRGIKILLDKMNLSLDDVVVFGDGLNDISMFNLAPISIAMGNAYQELKDVATYVTTPISEDGIKNALEKLELI